MVASLRAGPLDLRFHHLQMVASLRALHPKESPRGERKSFHHLQMVASLRVRKDAFERLRRAEVSTISRWWLH